MMMIKICRYKSIDWVYKLDFGRTHSEFNAVFFIMKCTLRHKQKPKLVFIQNVLSPLPFALSTYFTCETTCKDGERNNLVIVV